MRQKATSKACGSWPTAAPDFWQRNAIALEDGQLALDPNFLSAAEATRLYQELRQTIPWESRSIVLFGKSIPQPRLCAWYGRAHCIYRYSGLTRVPLPLNATLESLMKRVARAAGGPLNCVLLNYYRDGRDSMGWHSDDERELGPEPLIASLSLGATRRFDLRHKTNPGLTWRTDLAHGSLLLMGGRTQQHWRHQLPKQRGVNAGRINLTFRFIAAGQGSPVRLGSQQELVASGSKKGRPRGSR